MRKGQPRRWAMRPYTDKELDVVELRAKGIKPNEVARRLLITPKAVYCRLWSVYRKAGVHCAAEMIEWAKANAMDVPLEPLPPEVKPRRTKGWRTRETIRNREWSAKKMWEV